MTQGIRNRREISALAEIGVVVSVVRVGRNVVHVEPRTVHGQHRTVRVVRIAPGAWVTRRCRATSCAGCGVRSGLDRLRAQNLGYERYPVGLQAATRSTTPVIDVPLD